MKITGKILPFVAVPVLAVANGCASMRGAYASEASVGEILRWESAAIATGSSLKPLVIYRTDDPDQRIVGMVSDYPFAGPGYLTTDRHRFQISDFRGVVLPEGFSCREPTPDEIRELDGLPDLSD